MISFEEYIRHFAEMPDVEVKALLSLFEPKKITKNEYYAVEGKTAKSLAFLEKGLMRAFYKNDEGEEFNKIFFENPSIVGGYTSLITKEPGCINIQCLTDCEIIEANFEDIVGLYEENRSIETLNRKIAENFFVEKERREMYLVMYNATRRYEQFRIDFPNLENSLAQYHIASYLGITPVQLSRIRAKKD